MHENIGDNRVIPKLIETQFFLYLLEDQTKLLNINAYKRIPWTMKQ